MRKYLGWCPRLRQDTVFLTPQSQIPFSSRLIFFILFASWAAISLSYAVSQASYIYANIDDFLGLSGAHVIIYYFTVASADILALTLTVYYLVTSEVNDKHRLLLNLILATLLIQQVIWDIPNLLNFNFTVLPIIPLWNQLNYLLDLFDTVFVVIILGYAVNRSQSKRQIFTSKLFALIAVYYAYSLAAFALTTLYVTPMRFPEIPWNSLRAFNFIIIGASYLLVSVVSLSAFFGLRREGYYRFTLIPIIRATFLLYALSSLLMLGWFVVTAPDYISGVVGFGYLAIVQFILGIIRYLGVGAVAFTSLSIIVTKNVKTSNPIMEIKA
jgi:hypothetical protein